MNFITLAGMLARLRCLHFQVMPLERRYLIVPGIRSSRIYIFDVKEPLEAKIHKVIEPRKFCKNWLFAAAYNPVALKVFMSQLSAALEKTAHGVTSEHLYHGL